MIGLGVLVLLSLPFSWRRMALVTLMIAGFVLLFPIEPVRRFAALELPSETLGLTVVIGLAGVAALTATWLLITRLRQRPASGGA